MADSGDHGGGSRRRWGGMESRECGGSNGTGAAPSGGVWWRWRRHEVAVVAREGGISGFFAGERERERNLVF